MASPALTVTRPVVVQFPPHREGATILPGHRSEDDASLSNEANDVCTETDRKQLVEDSDSEEAGSDNAGECDSSESEEAGSENGSSDSSESEATSSSSGDSSSSNYESIDRNDDSTHNNGSDSSEVCDSFGSSDSEDSFCPNEESGSCHSEKTSTPRVPVNSSRLNNSTFLQTSRLLNSSLPPPCPGTQALDIINVFYSQFLQEKGVANSSRLTRVRSTNVSKTDAGDGEDRGSYSEATQDRNTTPGGMNNAINTISKITSYKESVEGPFETKSALNATSPYNDNGSSKKHNSDVQLDNVCVSNSMAGEGTNYRRNFVLSEAALNKHLERFHRDQNRDQVQDVIGGSNGAPQVERTLINMLTNEVAWNRSGGSDGLYFHVDRRNASDDKGKDMVPTDAFTGANVSLTAGKQIQEHPTPIYDTRYGASKRSDNNSLPDVINCSRDFARNGFRCFNSNSSSDEAHKRVCGDFIYLVPSQTRRTSSSARGHSSNENILPVNSPVNCIWPQQSLKDLPANSSTAAGRTSTASGRAWTSSGRASTAAGRASTAAGWALRERYLRLKCRGEVENIEDEFLYYEEDLLNSLGDDSPSQTDVINGSEYFDRLRDERGSDYNLPCNDVRNDVDYVLPLGDRREVDYVFPLDDGRVVDYVPPCDDGRDVDHVPPCNDELDVAYVPLCDDGRDVACVPLCGDERDSDYFFSPRVAAERSLCNDGHAPVKSNNETIIDSSDCHNITHCTPKECKDSGMGWSPSERRIAGSPGSPEIRSDRPVETPESEDSSSESEGNRSRDESEESSSEESTVSDTVNFEDDSSESESDDSSDSESENKSRSYKEKINDTNGYEISNIDSEYGSGSVHCETALSPEFYQNRSEAAHELNPTATTRVDQSCLNAIASIDDEDVEKKDIVDLTETAGNEENVKNVRLFNEVKEEGTCNGERSPEDPLRQGIVCFDEVKKYEVKEEIRSLNDLENVEDISKFFSQTHTESDLDRANQESVVKQSVSPEATVVNDQAADRANIASQANKNRSSDKQQISSNNSDSDGIDKDPDQIERLSSKRDSGASDDQTTAPAEIRSSLSLDQAEFPPDQNVKSPAFDASNNEDVQDDGSCESDLNSSSVSEHSASNSSAHSDSSSSGDEDEVDQRKIDEDETRTRSLIALRQSSDSESDLFRMKGGVGEDNTCEAMFSRIKDNTCEADSSWMDNGDGEDCYDSTSEHRGQQRAQDHKLDVDYTQFVVQHSLFGGLKKRGHLGEENEPNVLTRLEGSEMRCAGCRKRLKASVYSHLSRSKKCQTYYDMERIKEEHFDAMRQRKRRQSCELKRRKRGLLKSCEELPLSYKGDEKEECFGCHKKFLIILAHLKYNASCREKYDFEALLESHKKKVERSRAESRKKYAERKREVVTLNCEGDPRRKKCEGCGKMFMIHLLNHLYKSPSCQMVYGGKEGVRAMAKENRREQRIVHNRRKYIEKRDEIRESSRKYHHEHKEAIRRRKKECQEKNQRKIYERNLERFQTSKARKAEDERRKAVNFEQQDEVNPAEKNKDEQAQGTGVPFQNSARQRGTSDAEKESSLFATAHSPNEHENLRLSLPKSSGMCSLVVDTHAKEPSSLQDSSVLDVSVDHAPAKTAARGKVFLRGLVASEEPCSGCGKELKPSLYSHLSRSKRCQQHYDVGRVREQHFVMMKQRKRLQNRLYRRKIGGEGYSFDADNSVGTIDEEWEETAEMHGKKREDTIGRAHPKIEDTKQTCLGCNKQFRVILSHISSSAPCREHYDVEGMREKQRRQQRERWSELRRLQRSLAKEGKPNVNKCQACGLQFLISLVNHLQRSEPCQEVYGGRGAVLAMAKEERRKKNIALARRRFNEKKELVREEGRLYYRRNRQAVIMKSKKYWQKNKEKILERRRKYRQRLRDQKGIQEEPNNKGSVYLGLETALRNRPKETIAYGELSVVQPFRGGKSSPSGCGVIYKWVSCPDVSKVREKLAKFAFNAEEKRSPAAAGLTYDECPCASKTSNVMLPEGMLSDKEPSRNNFESISCPMAAKQQSSTVELGLKAGSTERNASVTVKDDLTEVSSKGNLCFGRKCLGEGMAEKMNASKSESYRTKESSDCNKENIACEVNLHTGPIIHEVSCIASVPKTLEMKSLQRSRVGGNSLGHLKRLTALDNNGTSERNKYSISDLLSPGRDLGRTDRPKRKRSGNAGQDQPREKRCKAE